MLSVDAGELGRTLAQRHRSSECDPTDDDRSASLVHYAESSRAGDWSLRSSLVRVAQSEPVRAGAVLELIRRCDAALAPFARILEATMVIPQVGADGELDGSGDAADTPAGRPEVRLADLARIGRHHPDRLPDVLAGYCEETSLTDEEVEALGLLVVAAMLDDLADQLTDWAAGGAGGSPPTIAIDRLSAEAFAALDKLRVPREDWTGPPNRRSRG